MPRLLALEWNESEARVAVASAHGKDDVVIEQAFSVSLRPSQPGEDLPAVDVGQRLSVALAARRVGRMDTLIAIGRTNIELRQLTVPPAPPEELPDMVRFQALREFNAMQEDWLLDYVPIDDVPDQPCTVLAAAMGPEQVEQIQKTCHGAGLKPRRLVLRPCAAASLYCRHQTDGRPRVRLLVDLLSDEADLTVMIDRKVIFLRTARLVGDPLCDSDAAQALMAEFRRTMAAVQNQLGGRKVESIVLCGTGPQHSALAELIDQKLNTPAETFDPFAGLRLGGDLLSGVPEHPGRFAPLLGLLADELHGDPHAVDFFHPRRRPEPPSKSKAYLLAGLAAAVVLGGLVFGYWYMRNSLQTEIDSKMTEQASWKKRVDDLSSYKKMADEIDAWQGGDVVWLNELKWLSENFPPAKEAMVTDLVMSQTNQGTEMKLTVQAQSVDALSAAEDKLLDKTHHIVKQDRTAGTVRTTYGWQSGITLTVGDPPKAKTGPARAPKTAPTVETRR